MMNDTTVAAAVALAAHYIAIGQTEIYIYRTDDADLPWQYATKVDAGGSWRLNGPAGIRIIAEHPCGLAFNWSVDFEGRDANGRGVSMFERDRLRATAMKLPLPARQQFAEVLKTQVLPAMRSRTADLRKALNEQQDSEDCVLGLIAFAAEGPTP